MTTKNIWQELPKPIFALAPMENVTDTVFRQIVISCGRPSIMFTEFTNIQGMLGPGREQVIHRLQYTQDEKPLIAQIWGITPENYYEAAQYITEQGFDGIDINMGCPVRKIVNKGCCSALIKNMPLAKEIIAATKEGSNGLPVSVKTRIGFNKIVTDEWIPFLLEQHIDALSVHGRTTKEQSSVPNHWEEIAKIHKYRKEIHPETMILGNGDIASYQDGLDKIKQYNLDGVMIGRGIFHNPWIFNRQINLDEKTTKDKLQLFDKHIQLYKETWTDEKYFAMLKKFIKTYVTDFPGSADVRKQLFETTTIEELHSVVQSLLE